MTISGFRDAVQKLLVDFPELEFDARIERDPDEFVCEITRKDSEWQYYFAAPSWLSMLMAVTTAVQNGDLDDAAEKYPDFF